MKYMQLGNSGIEVSRVCVGCMSFGKASADFHEWTLDPQDTEAIVKKALGLGINFFDTANTYSHGTSEEYLGAALKKILRATRLSLRQRFILTRAGCQKPRLNVRLTLLLSGSALIMSIYT